MAHLVKHLVRKHEIYCVYVKSPIMIAHAWNPSSREVERQGWSSGHTAQCLRIHTALIEDLSLVPSTHVRCLKMSCSSSSRAVIPFLVLWLVDTDSQAYIPIETHTIKKNKGKSSKNKRGGQVPRSDSSG